METSKRMKSGNVNKWNFFVREIDIVAPTRNSNCDFETERKSYCTYDILVLFILLSIHAQISTQQPQLSYHIAFKYIQSGLWFSTNSI